MINQIIEKGPVIGRYENRSIHEYLMYGDGLVLEFVHATIADGDGYALSQPEDDEYLVSPGLVYRRKSIR